MKTRFFDKIENRIFMIIVLTTLATAGAVYFILYGMFHELMLDDIRSRTDIVNQYAHEVIDPSGFILLNRREDSALPVYDTVRHELNRIRRIANVRYLYTAKESAEGRLIYLIDGLDPSAEDFRHVGDPIEPEVTGVLRACLDGGVVDSGDIMRTDWGPIFSTCWPVRDSGRTVGAVMMEFDAQSLYGGSLRVAAYSVSISALIAALFIAVARVTLHRVSEPFYKKLAYTDILTGLGNRTAFELDLKELEKDPARMAGVTLVAYDLNRLKLINDQYGHARGDDAIRRMAGVIRASGLAGPERHYRIGGDEFATVLTDGDPDRARDALEELFRVHHRPDAGPNSFEFSWGLASFDPTRDRNLHDVLSRADAAMYRRKAELRAARDQAGAAVVSI